MVSLIFIADFGAVFCSLEPEKRFENLHFADTQPCYEICTVLTAVINLIHLASQNNH